MALSLPTSAANVTELGYPYAPITLGHAQYLPVTSVTPQYHYIFKEPLSRALEKTKGYGLWAFWPAHAPEFIVFESEQAAIIFRLHYNP